MRLTMKFVINFPAPESIAIERHEDSGQETKAHVTSQLKKHMY